MLRFIDILISVARAQKGERELYISINYKYLWSFFTFYTMHTSIRDTKNKILRSLLSFYIMCASLSLNISEMITAIDLSLIQ